MRIQKNIAISDSGFLFNPATGESFTVNPIALEIINLLREGKTENEICVTITAHYFVELPIVQRDLHDFIHMIKQHQLTETNGGEND